MFILRTKNTTEERKNAMRKGGRSRKRNDIDKLKIILFNCNNYLCAMFNDRFSKGPIVESSPKSSEVSNANSLRTGGIARYVRATCAAILLAASLPSPAFSASPKNQADCHLASDPEKECALRDPMDYIDSVQAINKRRWAKEYWVAAYKKNPQAVLADSKKFAAQPYYREVILGALQWAAQQDPAVVFIFSSPIKNEDSPPVASLLDEFCEGQPNLKARILSSAAQRLVKVDPLWAIVHCKDFDAIPDGARLLMVAAAQDPSSVFERKGEDEDGNKCKHVGSLFLGAVRKDPALALRDPGLILEFNWAKAELFRAMRTKPEIALENLTQLKYMDWYREYFRELSKKAPTLALKDPNAIIEFDWAKDELYQAMRKNPEIALENLSKLSEWRSQRDYFRELSEVLLSKNPRYLLDHAHQMPAGIKKTMIVDTLKARFGE